MTSKNKVLIISILALLTGLNILWDYLCVDTAINKMNGNDFGKFYYSTSYFLHGRDMYGQSPATTITLNDNEKKFFWNLNPPHFHLLMLPFVFFPLKIAFLTWLTISFISLFIAFFLIFKEFKIKLKPTPLTFIITLLLVTAFSGMSSTLVTGQISFLLFLIVTLAWLNARKEKWFSAAFFLGVCISIKSFFIVFIPFLILRRKFKALSFLLTVITFFFLIGLAIFGIPSYKAWILASSKMDWAWVPMNGALLSILTRAFSHTILYDPIIDLPWLILPFWIGINLVIGTITAWIIIKDKSFLNIDRSFAFLLTTMLLISPLGWIYYSWVLFGPSIGLIYNFFKKNKQLYNPNHILLLKLLFILSCLWALIPLPAFRLFQPNPLATITLGSSYFWMFMTIWITLLVDYLIQLEVGKIGAA
jgi:hypothetical protein